MAIKTTGTGSLTIKPQRATPVQLTSRSSLSLGRATHALTSDVALWTVIRRSCDQMKFDNYMRFIDDVMCAGSFEEIREEKRERAGGAPDDKDGADIKNPAHDAKIFNEYKRRTGEAARVRSLPFTGADRYALLKAATEVFVMANCGVSLAPADFAGILRRVERDEEVKGTGLDLSEVTTKLWESYLNEIDLPRNTLPYYGIIENKLKDVPIDTSPEQRLLTSSCYKILQKKLQFPCFLELIWSYWHEEGMLVQTMNAITLRFQNVLASNRDPLANMEIDPLRPLNNLLWGLIQDEIHRLSVARRAYEYQHEYGLNLVGKALQGINPAESRSRFIEAFHNLLYLCSVFYKEDDDTTVVADGFPVLNAVKELHILLAEGAHNQYGDLPSTARQEMMAQEWILARPEMREFLPTRIMVAYEEPWMDRVDAMKRLQGWTDTSIYHFRDLGVFGEQILLSIRFGAWSRAFDADQGANWARFWRTEIQGYLHAYRAVTGVDLTSEVSTPEQGRMRFLPPSILLRNRLTQQLQQGRQGAATLPTSRQAPILTGPPALTVKGRT